VTVGRGVGTRTQARHRIIVAGHPCTIRRPCRVRNRGPGPSPHAGQRRPRRVYAGKAGPRSLSLDQPVTAQGPSGCALRSGDGPFCRESLTYPLSTFLQQSGRYPETGDLSWLAPDESVARRVTFASGFSLPSNVRSTNRPFLSAQRDQPAPEVQGQDGPPAEVQAGHGRPRLGEGDGTGRRSRCGADPEATNDSRQCAEPRQPHSPSSPARDRAKHRGRIPRRSTGWGRSG
jgi:hypothetical protein